jgi:PAS domain S-box-containing protein
MLDHPLQGQTAEGDLIAERLRAENRELRARLDEAEDALRAIREGEVDAVIVSGSQGDRVFSLMETENLHRLMVETMNEAGLAIASDGLLLYANGRASALLQRARSNLLGHPIEELVIPADVPRLRRLLKASREGTADDRVVFRTAAGDLVPMHLWASHLPRPGGSMICLVGTDLSRIEADQALLNELQAHQKALKASRAEALELMSQAIVAREQASQAARELRESDRRKDAFLATLAHELRNPLAPMRNAVEILRLLEIGAPAAVEARETIDRQLAHLVRLVDDLMDVQRITHGKIDLRKERVALATVIESAVETVRPLLETARQHLEVELPPGPLWLEGDPIRLSQIFGNLLNNAIKYTEQGQTIHIVAQAHPEGIQVSVRDTGVGIPTEMLPRVFDMFAQGSTSPTRPRGGIGIGLTLVRKLVGLHGGRVEAFSAGPGQGCEMRVHLPLARPDTRADGRRVDRRIPGRRDTIGRRILVVDDNQDAATSLARLLELKGATVRVAYDGFSALAALEESSVELVILDIGMPDLDGHQVARRIRARPEWNEIRLIAMTGFGETADRQRSLEAGFDQHLVKPVPLEVLEDLLASQAERMPPDRTPVPACTLEESIPPPDDPAPAPNTLAIDATVAGSLLHDLAQPLSSAGCYALAARTLAAQSRGPGSGLNDAILGIEEQVRRASKILERLRAILAPPEGSAGDPELGLSPLQSKGALDRAVGMGPIAELGARRSTRRSTRRL